MDEFLSQFLVESRELAEQAIENLLELERDPANRERFDEAFRALHTLKGGAGIVEFGAMQEAVHCAEDVLAATRKTSTPLSAADIGNCLVCVDQVVEWLDQIEATGELPRDADASAIVARFARADRSGGAADARVGGDDWAAALLAAHAAVAEQARTAIRYRPHAESFFRHQDPLERIAALPGLLAVAVEPNAPWPALADLDPFTCNLTLLALTSCAAADAAAGLGAAAADSEIVDLRATPSGAAPQPLADRARELLATQARLLDGERPSPGRVASAGVVAANVLHHLGRPSDAERVAAAAAESAARGTPDALRRMLAAMLAGAPASREPATPSASSMAAAPTARSPAPRDAARREQTLRVASPRIDALVRLTGELTVAKNAIGHAVKLAETQSAQLAPALKQRHEALERLVAEIQRSVLALRVLPLRTTFQRFPRLIREMSAELRKPTTLVIEGEDTEVDKLVAELIAEPLVHLLRNAMDHGVEDAPVRAAAGKPTVATLRVRAARDGDQVLIDVSDDGRGIDVARVREVARERAAVPAEALAAMSDGEALDLIFAPGFSTARVVTAISGRGVGLDAVRTAVKQLGGQVAVRDSSPRGTTVRLALPFSIMMTDVVTVEAGGQRFGIPLEAVVETLRIPRSEIFPVGGAHAIVLRGRTVPLVELASLLGTPHAGTSDATTLAVIAEVDGALGALAVESVGERLAVMLKPLDGILAGLPGLAGSTLLGDGSVLLVLDLAELLQ